MCDNKVTYYVQSGYDYRETSVKCGLTDPYGDRAICDSCSSDREKMRDINDAEESIAADNAWAKSAGWGEY